MILRQLETRKRKSVCRPALATDLTLSSTYNSVRERFEQSKALTAATCTADGSLLMHGHANGKIQLKPTAQFYTNSDSKPVTHATTFDLISELAFYPDKTGSLFLAAGASSKHPSDARRSRKYKNPSFVSVFDTCTMEAVENFAPWSGDTSPAVQGSTVSCLKTPPIQNLEHSQLVAVGLTKANSAYLFDLRTGSAVQGLKLLPRNSLKSYIQVPSKRKSVNVLQKYSLW